MSHPNTVRYTVVERARPRARGSGLASARFLGYNSPKIICTTVAAINASTVPTVTPTAAGTPTPPSRVPSEWPTSGSATNPTSSPVTVIPNWAPESMNEVRWVTFSARAAEMSPASARALSLFLSTDMYANSWATK